MLSFRVGMLSFRVEMLNFCVGSSSYGRDGNHENYLELLKFKSLLDKWTGLNRPKFFCVFKVLSSLTTPKAPVLDILKEFYF